MIKVFVVDDQKLVREQLKYIIGEEDDLEVIGTANDGYTAIEQINDVHPDVILMDIEMPGLNGLKAAEIIRQQYANAKIVILTSHENNQYVSNSLSIGADGYVLKQNVNSEIAEVIRSVHRGYTQISTGILERFVSRGNDENVIDIVPTSNSLSRDEENFSSSTIDYRRSSSSNGGTVSPSMDSGNVSQDNSGIVLRSGNLSSSGGIVHTPSSPDSSALQVSEEYSSDLDSPSQLYVYSKTGLSKIEDWSQSARELVDTLPLPWTRGLLYLLVGCFGLIVPWTYFYHIDDVGTARGRLEIQGNTIKREADIDGSVSVLKVYVKQGDKVKAGQVLMELDPKNLKDEIQQNQVKIEGQQQRLNQMMLMKNQLVIAINTQEQQNQAQQLEKQSQIDQAHRSVSVSNQNYSLQEQEKLAQLRQLEETITNSKTNARLQQQERLNQVRQAQQRANDSKINYDLTVVQLKDALLEVDRYQDLVKSGAVAESKLREVESLAKQREQARTQALATWQQSQLVVKEQQDNYKKAQEQSKAELNDANLKYAAQRKTLERSLGQTKGEIGQSKLRVEEQNRSYQTLVQAGKLAIIKNEQQLKELQGQITNLEVEINQAKNQINILKKRLEKYTIRSNFDGTIFDLPIAREGAVVQPKQLLAEIAPDNNNLVFRGQIATGQSESLRNRKKPADVKLKFDEFPFQKYGIVDGSLTWMSPNSKMVNGPQGVEINYEIEVKLDNSCIKFEGKCLPLQSGQSATAEVVIRRRRIIEILLDPLLKLKGGF
jgi:HlyD family secretion protein